MEEQKFERQDFLNGLALATVLIILLSLILVAALSCSTSLGNVAQGEKKVPASTTTLAEVSLPEEETTPVAPPKEAAEVTIRVGNGANKSGLATSGTRLLSQNDYTMLQGRTKEGPSVETSVVYFNEDYTADAELVAELLSIQPDQVLPMPEDPGVPIDSANIVVILGEDAEF